VPETVAEADTVRIKSHRVALKEDEERARAAIETAFEKAGLAAPGIAETLAQAGVETARARPLLAMLLKENRVVKIGDDLALHRSALENLRITLATRRGKRFGVPQFKEWTGVSRKYAIPLLEYLDRERVTRREGNERVIL
jgi:selenocysteine-specific elongation factor